MLQSWFYFAFWLFWLGSMWDLRSLTRDGPCMPCTGRRSLNHLSEVSYWKKEFKGNSASFLECGMAIHSSTLAWKIPWMEEHDRLQSMGSQRVRHDWATSLSLSKVWRCKTEAKLSFFHLCGQQLHSLILHLSYTLVWNNYKNFYVK